MDIEKLAAKLRPLAPKTVSRWLRIRESADPETARLLEQQIRATARRLLGETDDQVLLSLPPQKLVAGPIKLGTVVYAGDRSQAGISAGDLMQNMAVFGRSGAGKTNAVFHILEQLAEQGIPFLFLDWKRTARHLAPRLKSRPSIFTPGRPLAPFPFNPFTPPPALEFATYVGLLVDVMADAYDLGDGAISVLLEAIYGCYADGNLSPTAADILGRIRAAPPKGRAVGWTASATRALQSIDFAGLVSGGRASQQELAEQLMGRSTIVELDGLNAASRRFLIPILCLWLYYQRMAAARRETLSLVVVVEEAHNVLMREKQRGAESVMSMLLRQCREIGIGMMVVDQHPHLTSSTALGNTAVTLVLNLKDPADVAKAATLCALEDRRCLTMLPIGHAVVKLQDRWRRPFLIRMPLVPVEKGRVTDDQLRDSRAGVQPKSTGSAVSGSRLADPGGSGQVRTSAIPLDEDALRVLEDVCAFPDDGVRERYSRLRLSGERGNRAKRMLLTGGWIEQQLVSVGRSRKALLRPTAATRDLLQLSPLPPGEGSIAHGYWRRWYARMLREDGYDVQEEAPRVGGRADLLARQGDQLMAVEIETGRSDVAANVRRCLQSGFVRVLVVATDSNALGIVERSLGAAGLLGANRVTVVCGPAAPSHAAPMDH